MRSRKKEKQEEVEEDGRTRRRKRALPSLQTHLSIGSGMPRPSLAAT